jgi:streptogramin lyase
VVVRPAGSHNHLHTGKHFKEKTELSQSNPELFYGMDALTAGPDGNMWFTTRSGYIVSLTPLGHFTVYPLQNGSYRNLLPGIVTGPDKNLWFMTNINTIWRVTPQGIMTPFTVPATLNTTNWNALTSAGNRLWFTDPDGHQLVSMTIQGAFTSYPLPDSTGKPGAITTGPDGSLWFNDLAEDEIWHFTPPAIAHSHTPKNLQLFQAFSIVKPSIAPEIIVAGTNGDLWITEPSENLIGRLTPHSQITEYSIHSAPPVPQGPPSSRPTLITGGPDGNIWFLESNGNKVGGIPPTGIITEFPVQAPLIDASAMTFGADGNLWIAINNTLVRVTQRGVENDFPLASDSYVTGIAAGPDGNIWFTESGSGKIGRLILHQS